MQSNVAYIKATVFRSSIF